MEGTEYGGYSVLGTEYGKDRACRVQCRAGAEYGIYICTKSLNRVVHMYEMSEHTIFMSTVLFMPIVI